MRVRTGRTLEFKSFPDGLEARRLRYWDHSVGLRSQRWVFNSRQFRRYGEKNLDKPLEKADLPAQQFPRVVVDHHDEGCYKQDQERIENQAVQDCGA